MFIRTVCRTTLTLRLLVPQRQPPPLQQTQHQRTLAARAMTTIASIPRVSAQTLADMIRAEPGPQRSFAIVDVRDDDYIGGQIHGSTNIPSRMMPQMSPALVYRFRTKKKVIFHCALSQQRGPSAAVRYARDRAEIARREQVARLEKAESAAAAAAAAEGGEGAAAESAGGVKESEKERVEEEEEEEMEPNQEVMVLDQGFVGWQELFGEDTTLTEGYNREVWKNGY